MWPLMLRTSSSHEEGGQREWSVSTERFTGENGKVQKLHCVRVELKAGQFAALKHNVAALFGFFPTIRAIDKELPAGHPAIAIGERDLVAIGRLATTGPRDCDAMGASLSDLNRREIAIYIGRQIMPRIANFVHELLDNGTAANGAAGAGGLSDDAVAIGGQFGNRIADIGKFILGPIDTVAAGGLSAALDQMARYARGSQLVPVVPLPAEMRHRRTDCERCISHAARDNNPRAPSQSVRNGSRT